jgi:NADH-dependent peroxiredoxin subunit F
MSVKMKNIYDTIIIGGGPAGVAAGVYAARKKMKTLFIAKEFGGQSIVSAGIGNWIGEKKISGFELSQKLESHLRAQEGIEIRTGEKTENVEEEGRDFVVRTDKNKYLTKTVIVCSGGRDRRLGVPGEEMFAGKGVAYCSTCDAPFFKDKKVVVVGGGNAGLEAVIDLDHYANEIVLLELSDTPPGDQTTLEIIKKNEKVSIHTNAKIKQIIGNQAVEGVVYMDLKTGEEKELSAQGVFVEIGVMPNSEIVKDLVRLNSRNEIVVVSPCTGATSKRGIFAAGDVTDEQYKQNNIAAGDAIKATLSAYKYVMDRKREK